MPVVYPWYSQRVGEVHYHNNTLCTEGNNIESYYRASGTGGKTLCSHCQRLNAQGR